MILPHRSAGLLAAGVLSIFCALDLFAGEPAAPGISERDVQAFRDANLNTWLATVSPGKQRLFYDETAWQAESGRIASLTGEGAKWRTRLLEAADRIASTSFPPYVAPHDGQQDAEGWQRSYGDSLACLAVAAKIQPDKKYLEKLHAMVMAACGFSTWGRMGKRGELPNMDLAAGHMSKGLALAYDWHRDLFSEQEKNTIRDTFRQKMPFLLRGLYGEIFWAKWYTQNHNHISVAGLGLAGAAFLGEIPEASEWLAASVLDFRHVADEMYPDGSIYEGVMYWGYGRTFILEYIEGTKAITGAGSFYDRPFLKNTIAFRMGCSTPGYNGVLLWGDSRGYDATGPQQILYRLASRYRNGQGQYLADHLPFAPQGAADAVAWSLLWYDPTVEAVPPTALDYHAPVLDIVTSRSGWGAGDYMLSFKAGYNWNHHTKVDEGSLALSFGSQWLLMAPGYGLGALQSGFFDEAQKRWQFLSNTTESHSTLLINGISQKFGPEADGVIDRYVSSPSILLAEEDLSQVYDGVQTVRRRLLHRRGDYALVLDQVKASAPVTVEWLAQVPPSAMEDSGELKISGMQGNLKISMLGGAPSFSKRTPTAPIVDVSPSWMTTYSSKTSGTDVGLAAILQPEFSKENYANFKITSDTEGAIRHISVSNSSWQDDNWLSPAAVEMQAGSDVSSVAELLSARHSGSALVSWVASGATMARDGMISMQSAHPFQVAVESMSDGGRVVSLGSGFEGAMTLPAGFALFDEAGSKPGTGAAVTLAAGRYYMMRDAGSLHDAEAWVSGLFPPHEAVQNIPVVAPGAQPGLNANTSISWEAEDGPMPLDGGADIAPRKEASHGQVLLNFGSESPAHSIGWIVNVPQAGTYNLSLRYAVGQPQVDFAVTVDGVAQSPDALLVSVRGDNGWGRERYFTLDSFSWKDAPVETACGKPLTLSLTAGKHEIRLLHPTAGMNLDKLTLVGTGSK